MANYLTTTDVANRLRRTYTSAYTRDGALDTDLVDADIDNAEGIVDGYLASRYVTPITDATALRMITAWALTIVEELAYSVIGAGELPAGLKDRVAAVYRQLEAVQSGALSLGATPAPAEQTDVADSLIIDGDTPIMTNSGMAGL
jgi:phage gp36-like protein